MRFAWILLLCAAAFGQDVRPKIDRTEWALLASDAAARGLDVYSTHRALAAGNREVVLPGWIADHVPVMALYSGGIVAGQYYTARRLRRHPRLAHLIAGADVSITLPSAVRNLYMRMCGPGEIDTAHGCGVR